ncbi:MAG: ABC transporter ATP-binding protein [Selenomonadaceae bacterium]|nr:ABC transporter ATP-binding protein [Selenomonadaceae bacterium]
MAGAVLAVENLSVSYDGRAVVRRVNFTLRRGEILVIAGESGSGKSTVLKAVMGILGRGGAISEGRIVLQGRDITSIAPRERRKLAGETLAMIFQNAGASFCPIRRVGEQIYESVREHRNWSRAEFRTKAKVIMEHINLPENALDEYPFRLSGGMGQRVGILAAMILEPELLLADEPTSALDTVTQVKVAQELMGLRERLGLSLVMVTHHMGLAWYMADKILVMRRGQMLEIGDREQIFNSPRDPYTQELIRAVPRFKETA